MSHQVALTLAANVRAGEVERLKRLLATMGDGVANTSVVDFGALDGVHFARFVVLDEAADLEGRPLPAALLYMSDLDVARERHLGQLVAVPLLLLVLSPLLLLTAPVFVVLLRRHERSDRPPHLKPPPELVQELASLEDHLVHNPFTAIGFVKPGRFRLLTLTGVLYAIDYVTRHVFNRGDLAGVKTIHFARWVFLDGRRRVIFASNYDGSLESYMDDFIDKIAWGLNIVFSNGLGFPRARWLVLDG